VKEKEDLKLKEKNKAFIKSHTLPPKMIHVRLPAETHRIVTMKSAHDRKRSLQEYILDLINRDIKRFEGVWTGDKNGK